MTGFTKSHEVAFFVAATFGEREDVVYFLGRSKPALSFTLLTKRMGFDVAVTNSLPSSAVSFVGSRVAFILVIIFVHYLFMFLAVLLALGKPTAAGISTGTFGFVGHRVHLLAGIRKALRDCSRKALLDSVFLIVYYHKGLHDKQ